MISLCLRRSPAAGLARPFRQPASHGSRADLRTGPRHLAWVAVPPLSRESRPGRQGGQRAWCQGSARSARPTSAGILAGTINGRRRTTDATRGRPPKVCERRTCSDAPLSACARDVDALDARRDRHAAGPVRSMTAPPTSPKPNCQQRSPAGHMTQIQSAQTPRPRCPAARAADLEISQAASVAPIDPTAPARTTLDPPARLASHVDGEVSTRRSATLGTTGTEGAAAVGFVPSARRL